MAASASWAKASPNLERGGGRWLKESSHKATLGMDKTHLRWLDRFLGGKHLDEISRSLIDRITDARLAEGLSNATVNRSLEVLRAILRRCVNDWEWLDRAPQVRMLKEPTRRVRFITREEARRLLSNCLRIWQTWRHSA